MYLLTEILIPFYTGMHLCHSKLFMDLEDGAMAWVDYNDLEDRKLWHEVTAFHGSRQWIYEKKEETPTNDRIYYCIEEVKVEDLQPCDVTKQMKLDI